MHNNNNNNNHINSNNYHDSSSEKIITLEHFTYGKTTSQTKSSEIKSNEL